MYQIPKRKFPPPQLYDQREAINLVQKEAVKHHQAIDYIHQADEHEVFPHQDKKESQER